MAKQKDKLKDNKEPQKRGGLLGVFDSIKVFFLKIIDKIKEYKEYRNRVSEGKSNYENSIEGQAASRAKTVDDAFGYQTREQHEQNQIHFPGFNETEMTEGGLIRIPANVELIWENNSVEDAAKRYVACMDDKFAGRPDPIQTGNPQAFIDVTRDMYKAMKNNDMALHQFVLGNTLIKAQFNGEKCAFTISNGLNTKSFESSEYNDIITALTTEYTNVNGNGKLVIYSDAKTGTESFCLDSKDGYQTYMVSNVVGFQGIGDNQTRYDMPNIKQVKGPQIVPPNYIDAIVEKQEGPASPIDIETVIKKAYKEAKVNEGSSSMFVVGDKVLSVVKQNDSFNVVIAPHHCQYTEIKPIMMPFSQKVFNSETGAFKSRKAFYEVEAGMKQIDSAIEQQSRINEIEKNLKNEPAEEEQNEPAEEQFEESEIDENDVYNYNTDESEIGE